MFPGIGGMLKYTFLVFRTRVRLGAKAFVYFNDLVVAVPADLPSSKVNVLFVKFYPVDILNAGWFVGTLLPNSVFVPGNFILGIGSDVPLPTFLGTLQVPVQVGTLSPVLLDLIDQRINADVEFIQVYPVDMPRGLALQFGLDLSVAANVFAASVELPGGLLKPFPSDVLLNQLNIDGFTLKPSLTDVMTDVFNLGPPKERAVTANVWRYGIEVPWGLVANVPVQFLSGKHQVPQGTLRPNTANPWSFKIEIPTGVLQP
jgi:hypothetical protein